jgi:putative FmdB family regulatory protein
MPLYEFECEACKKRFERIQKFSDPNPDVCPTCGKSPVRKLPSSPAIQFKGSGFYITDYAKKPSESSSESGSKSRDGDKSGGDNKSGGDSKSSDGGSSTSASAPAEKNSGSTDSASTSSSDKKT